MTCKFIRKYMRLVFSVLAIVLLLTTVSANANDNENKNDARVVAFVDIFGCAGQGMLGRAVLMERPSDQGVKTVAIRMNMKGLSPGQHAVHIHEQANCEPCGSAGGHHDPGLSGSSAPDGNHPFHMGDLENIDANSQGVGTLNVSTTRITLSPGPLSVLDSDGSSLIIHNKVDTFCPNGEIAGCAGGGRFACGIVESL